MPTYTKKEFLNEARKRLTTGRAYKQYLRDLEITLSTDEDVIEFLKRINDDVQRYITIFDSTDSKVIAFDTMIKNLSKANDNFKYNDKNLNFLGTAIKTLKNIKVEPAPTKRRKAGKKEDLKKEDLKLNVTVLTQQLREIAAQYAPEVPLNNKCNRWANLIDPNADFEPVHKMHEQDGLTVRTEAKGSDVPEVKFSMPELNIIIKGLAKDYLDKGLVKTHDEYYQMLSEVPGFNTTYINQVLKYREDMTNLVCRVTELNPDLALAVTNYFVASSMVDTAALARVQAILARGGDALETSSASAIDSNSSMRALTNSDFVEDQILSLIGSGSLPRGEIERITRVLEAEGFGRHWRGTLDMIQEVMAHGIIIPQSVLNKMQANAALINGLREVARELVNESPASLTSNQLALALSGDVGELTAVMKNQEQEGDQSKVVFILSICNLLGADDSVEPNQLERLVTLIDSLNDSHILVLAEVAGLPGINRLSELSGRNILELCSARTRNILQDVDKMPEISGAAKLAIQELASSRDIEQVVVPPILIDMVNQMQSSNSSQNPEFINALRVLIVISGQQDRIAGNARRAAIEGADSEAPAAAEAADMHESLEGLTQRFSTQAAEAAKAANIDKVASHLSGSVINAGVKKAAKAAEAAPAAASVAPAAPVEQSTTKQQKGFFSKVADFFKGIWNGITKAINAMINAIKGLFTGSGKVSTRGGRPEVSNQLRGANDSAEVPISKVQDPNAKVDQTPEQVDQTPKAGR